jgi:hypothetical protein
MNWSKPFGGSLTINNGDKPSGNMDNAVQAATSVGNKHTNIVVNIQHGEWV